MTLAEFLFSCEGRINREQFWLRCIILNIEIYILVLAWRIDIAMLVFLTLCLLITGSNISAIVKRLCDTNRSGKNLLWIFVYPVGVIYLFLLCCISKGTEGTNKYGEPAPKLTFDFKNPKEIYEQILVLTVVCILIILAC